MRIRFLFVPILAAVGCGAPPSEPETAETSSPEAAEATLVAELGERAITLEELDRRIMERLFRQATEGDAARLYELRSESLDRMIGEQLLEEEAARRGVEAEALLEAESLRFVEVTDEEIRGFWEQVRGNAPDSEFENVEARIRGHLEREERRQAAEVFLASLREKADVRVMLEPPRVDVAAVGRARGPEDAPVTIIEFSDYECPYCKNAEPTVKALLERYPEQVRYVYRHFPLEQIHPLARGASHAAECAAQQDRFWDYHDKLFENAPRLDRAQLVTYAKQLELDTEAFVQCLDDESVAAAIDRDFEAGRKAGVQGTPAFFVNGIPVSGARSVERFVQMIEAELSREEDA